MLFLEEDLRQIVANTEISDYTDESDIFFGINSTDIIRQDFETGLILPKGNLETGYEHIIARHFGRQMKNFRGRYDSPTSIELNNPTIFVGDIIPYTILNYAKNIYSDKCLKKNSHNGLFDIYEGNVSYGQEYKDVKSRLVTYRGYPIVHTFYIAQGGNYKNKNKVIDYYRGSFSCSHNVAICKQTFRCTYFDEKNEKIFEYLQIEDSFNELVTIEILVDDLTFSVFTGPLKGKNIEGVNKMLNLDFAINDKYEQMAIRKFNEIKNKKSPT